MAWDQITVEDVYFLIAVIKLINVYVEVSFS